MHAEGKWKSLPVILQATGKEQEEGRFPGQGSREDAIIYKRIIIIILCSFLSESSQPSNYLLYIQGNS